MTKSVGSLCCIIATVTRLDRVANEVGMNQPIEPMAWLLENEPVIILDITDDWCRFQVLTIHGNGWIWAGHCKPISKFCRGKRTRD